MKTKFQIQELLGIGMTLVVLGIGLAYGLEVLGDVRDDAADNAASSTASTNEAITFSNATATSLGLDCTSGVSCTALMNASSGLEIGSGNYTCAGDDITPTIDGFDAPASTLYVNYSCKTSTAEYNATGNAIDGVAKIPNKMATIATVIVAAVIIGILVTYLWGRFQ